MHYSMKKTLPTLLTALSLYIPHAVMANNISDHGSPTTNESDGGYFKIGLGGGMGRDVIDDEFESGFGVPIEGRYEWKGAFAEVSSSSIGVPGLALGYTMWQSPDWTVDAIVTLASFFDPDDYDRTKNSNLKERNGALLGGIRATRFYKDFVFQSHVLAGKNKGLAVALAAGHYWQVKNWNFMALLSTRYNSAKYNDFYYGIDEDETSDEFDAYEAGSGLNFQAEIAAEYPISENWVFETAIRHTELSSAMSDSPIFTKDRTTGIRASISYVF